MSKFGAQVQMSGKTNSTCVRTFSISLTGGKTTKVKREWEKKGTEGRWADQATKELNSFTSVNRG